MFRALLTSLLLGALLAPQRSAAQVFPFASGPIAMCDTNTFTATVSGVGTLITPDGWNWGAYLDNVLINITTDHPQTLSISLTSPQGTTLLLSAFNGAGGQNYNNTYFPYWGGSNITLASAPFSGSYNPQGGALSVFDWENADGTWTLTVIDTACSSTNPGTGGPWTPGWFNGGSNSGAMSFGFSSPPPPCIIDMGSQGFAVCPGETVDILTYYESSFGAWGLSFNISGWPAAPSNPYAVGAAGSYTIEGWDWSGCYYFGNVGVVLTAGVALGPDQALSQCSGAGPVDLSALFNTAGATTLTWTLDGAPITAAAASAATIPGVYELTAANQGCSDVAQATLSIDLDPVLGPDQSLTICEGSTTDLTALLNTAGLAEAWTLDGVPIAAPVDASAAGTYAVSVTTAQGCADMASVVLGVQPLPTLGADQGIGLCNGSTADLTSLYTTGVLSTTWTFGGAALNNASAVSSGGVYQLVAADAVGCSDTALVDVTLWSTPVLGADVSATICAGASLDLTTYYSTAGLNASWTHTGAPVVDATAVDVAGTYTLTVTDANGCSDAADVVLTIAANPVLGPDQQINACAGSTVDLTALYVTGSNAVSWTVNGATVADPSAVTGGGIYVLEATSAAGCSATSTVTLSLDPTPAIGDDVTAAICEGSSYDLTMAFATAGLTTTWTLNGTAVSDATVITSEGNYQLVVTNGYGCTDTAVVLLTVNQNPDLGDDQFFTLCPWQTVDLGGVFPVAGLSASYTIDGVPVDSPQAVADSGAYSISVIDANGCTDEAIAVVVEVECLCEADFITDAHCMQDRSRFTVVADSAMVGAQWDFNGLASPAFGIEPEVMLDTEGEVVVTMRAQLTCGLVTVQRTITMSDCSDSCSVFIPNAFTPNNDDQNDAWAWVGDCHPDEFQMQVFNVQGELIYSTEDPSAKWDGTYHGTASQGGVYVYKVRYRLPYQDRKERMGHVTLLK